MFGNEVLVNQTGNASVTFPSLGYRIAGNGAIADYNWTANDHKARGYYWSSMTETSNDAYHLTTNQFYTNLGVFELSVPENLDVENEANIRCVRNY
ncbi:hypothetical protein LZQ00_06350 [Sphingobacterium sp. SRCM116780]|uniref:hypothetical protein n=1 Tax=Sphingobacterium sp. SRCM116780 TaxID=2907623 RepID=UPI001F40254C|nr:hypothetical protein [Sphingobacterium sp. SRCM116780]UIR57435.1 hypothetical protein LZQ00_06350 [Sphingobacterium sp. SRCM116780]